MKYLKSKYKTIYGRVNSVALFVADMITRYMTQWFAVNSQTAQTITEAKTYVVVNRDGNLTYSPGSPSTAFFSWSGSGLSMKMKGAYKLRGIITATATLPSNGSFYLRATKNNVIIGITRCYILASDYESLTLSFNADVAANDIVVIEAYSTVAGSSIAYRSFQIEANVSVGKTPIYYM